MCVYPCVCPCLCFLHAPYGYPACTYMHKHVSVCAPFDDGKQNVLDPFGADGVKHKAQHPLQGWKPRHKHQLQKECDGGVSELWSVLPCPSCSVAQLQLPRQAAVRGDLIWGYPATWGPISLQSSAYNYQLCHGNFFFQSICLHLYFSSPFFSILFVWQVVQLLHTTDMSPPS